MTPALPLDSAQVSETLRPLEKATMLPPAAFTRATSSLASMEMRITFAPVFFSIGSAMACR